MESVANTIHRHKMELLTSIVILTFVQFSKQDSCHWRELDLCSVTALSSMQNPPIPKSEADIDQQCKNFRENAACVRKYTDSCLTPLQQELLTFATEEGRKNIDAFCTSGNEMRKNVLKHATCLSEAWPEQNSCVNDVQAALETLGNADPSKRATISCCTYQRFRQCATDIMKTKCGGETVEFINQLITVYASDVPNIVCSSYNSNESKCKGALPEPGTAPKGSSYNDLITRFISTYIGN